MIRQQAHDKQLDPALIAAVIYAESKFVDSTSSAGALGLMQLLPSTAHFIAERSGGTAFTTEDLSTPEINIAYGSWYLRYLLDRYDGDEVLALAAYNGGMGNVDRWVADAQARGERDSTSPTSRSRRRARTWSGCSTRGATTAGPMRTSSAAVIARERYCCGTLIAIGSGAPSSDLSGAW